MPPHKAFSRRIGSFAGAHIGSYGRVIDAAEWNRPALEWLPSADEGAYLASPMGRLATRRPIDFGYERFG